MSSGWNSLRFDTVADSVMKFTSTVSVADDPLDAAREAIERTRSEIDPSSVDFLAVFASGHGVDEFRDIVSRLGTTFGRARSIGCTAEGTIGDGKEFEEAKSLAVLAGSLPQVRIRPFHVTQDILESDTPLADALGVKKSDQPVFLALGDPFSVDIRRLLEGLNADFGGCPVVGGMASAGRRPGENALLLDGAVHQEGLVGLALTGNVSVTTVVSQGCRPIGRPYIVTKGDANVVRSLRNLRALDALKEVVSQLSSEDKALLESGFFLGRAIDEYKSQYGRGDFLIQNVMGADPDSGAIAIGGEVRVGTTVQFHVRDADSADEDLRNLLQKREGYASPAGALLFSCNGRGTRMWTEPGHDATALRQTYGDLPFAGFFCAGELGPVGGQNFIHGFTASIALFRPRE